MLRMGISQILYKKRLPAAVFSGISHTIFSRQYHGYPRFEKYTSVEEVSVVQTHPDSPNGFQSDIDSHFFNKRCIFVTGELDTNEAGVTCAQLQALDSVGTEPIRMYIHSSGSTLDACLAIYNTMATIKSPVATICYGQAEAFSSVLLAAGAPKLRIALPHSTVSLSGEHPPEYMEGEVMRSLELGNFARQHRRKKNWCMQIYRDNLPIGRVRNRSVRNLSRMSKYAKGMTAEEAREFGLIDHVALRPEEYLP